MARFRPYHAIGVVLAFVAAIVLAEHLFEGGFSRAEAARVAPDREGKVRVDLAGLAPSQVRFYRFLNTANQALVDPAWAGYPGEVYLFAAFVYFVFCYSMSRYSKYLEVELNKGTRR